MIWKGYKAKWNMEIISEMVQKYGKEREHVRFNAGFGRQHARERERETNRKL